MVPIPSVCPRNLLVSIYTPRWRGAQCKLSVLTKDNNTMILTSTEPRELDPKFNVNTDNVRQTRSLFLYFGEDGPVEKLGLSDEFPMWL